MKTKLIYLFTSFLLPALLCAQDFTGIWKGEFYVDSTKKYYPFELSISKTGEKYSGYSRITFDENGITQVVIRDHRIAVTSNELIVEDESQLSKASSISQPREVKKTMLLTFSSTDSLQRLSGTWSTNKTKKYLIATGTVNVQKKIDFKSTDIFKKLSELSLTDKLSFNKEIILPPIIEEKVLPRKILTNLAKVKKAPVKTGRMLAVSKPNPKWKQREAPIAIVQRNTAPVEKAIKVAPPPTKPALPVKPAETIIAKAEQKTEPVIRSAEKRNVVLPEQKNAATDVANRTNSSIQSLYYSSDSLQLTLYDNGEIDGDTVSVLLDGKVIIARWGLNTKPNNYTLYFDRDSPDSMMLVMYAENLGSIPPNTGLLVVREGRSVYEVRFSADLKSNAAVILRRRRN